MIIVAKVVKQSNWWFVDDVGDVDDIGVVGEVGEVVDNDGEDGTSASLKMRIFMMVLPAPSTMLIIRNKIDLTKALH